MQELSGKHLLFGLTGGVAAYKVCELIRRTIDEGATVQVVLSRAAESFVTPTTLQAISGRSVFTSAWDDRIDNAMPHIELTRNADAILVAPATAHFIARLAGGFADDLLTTLSVARPRPKCPLLVAPAMNVEMWTHPSTQRNVETARVDGAQFLGPASGDQACGETGYGRMLEPADILDELIAVFQVKWLLGKNVLITAGPTFEPIDPVRGITNLSSGKMGFAIARAAHDAGAMVTLISGPCHLAARRGVIRIDVTTAEEMHREVMANVGKADIFISVAAVADWRIDQASPTKLKKSKSGPLPTLNLQRNVDILAAVASRPSPPFCVGFAAETDNVIENAKMKLANKRVPIILANSAQSALGSNENELFLVDAFGVLSLTQADKLTQARRVVAEVATRFARLSER